MKEFIIMLAALGVLVLVYEETGAWTVAVIAFLPLGVVSITRQVEDYMDRIHKDPPQDITYHE